MKILDLVKKELDVHMPELLELEQKGIDVSMVAIQDAIRRRIAKERDFPLSVRAAEEGHIIPFTFEVPEKDLEATRAVILRVIPEVLQEIRQASPR